MQTLNEIISDLKTIASENNYSGATIDALIYMLASGIYKNQMNVVNVASEISPSMCTLVNSAIQHAQDKNYSVYRGKNQHIILRHTKPKIDAQVKKYDVCTRIGKYKLVYANDYNLSDITTNSGAIELILCEDIVEETLQPNLKKYVRSISTDITEDLGFYVNDEITDYSNSINIGLSSAEKTYINKTCDSPYLILTDTDYGVICWCYNAYNSDLSFDTNYIYKIKSPKYTEDTITRDVIKTIPNFDLSETLASDDGIELISNYLREDDVNNIYIESSVAEHSGNIIRSVNDIKNIFVNYFGKINIKSCKCYLDKNKIHIIYLLNDKNQSIDDASFNAFQQYLAKAYFVAQEVEIEKAWAYNPTEGGLSGKFEYDEVGKKQYNVTLVYSDRNKNTAKESFTVDENTYFDLPNGNFLSTNDTKNKFVGWRLESTEDNYGFTGQILVTSNITLEMTWCNQLDVLRTINLYKWVDSGSLIDDNLYQHIYIVPDTDGKYSMNYIPDNVVRNNYIFNSWENYNNPTEKYKSFSTFDSSNIEDDMTFVGTFDVQTYTVKFYMTNSEIFNTLGYAEDDKNRVNNIINQNVISGNTITVPSTPSTVSRKGYKLRGFYYCEELDEKGNGKEGVKRYKFDVGTPITQNINLVAMYSKDVDLSMEIYFDLPLNNTELHNFVNEYSYDIGETFEPMKIATQMSKKYDGISWIDLNTSKENVSIPKNAYYDFTYELVFNNSDVINNININNES